MRLLEQNNNDRQAHQLLNETDELFSIMEQQEQKYCT